MAAPGDLIESFYFAYTTATLGLLFIIVIFFTQPLQLELSPNYTPSNT